MFLFHADPGELVARARQAEQGGFDGIFVAETLQDPFQQLAILAEHSSSITLGTAIALAFPRSPMLAAMSGWDLARSSNGRFILGLGSQVQKHIERRFSSAYEHPAARLGEYSLAVKHIWESFQHEHPMDFHGDFYDLDFLPDAVNPGPLPSGPPHIYLAALGPLMFRTAGRVADGAMVHPVHSVEYLRTVAEPAIARGLQESSRSREDFHLEATAFSIIGTGEEGRRDRELMRAQFAFYASTPAYSAVLELHGWGPLHETLRSLVREKKTDEMTRAVPDEVLDEFCIVADNWSDAAALARERYAGVVDRIAFHTAPPLNVRLS
jgi:probable F420-dependent oxidoreductase